MLLISGFIFQSQPQSRPKIVNSKSQKLTGLFRLTTNNTSNY